MDIEKALALNTATELKRACCEAEARNVDIEIINTLYRRYWAACEREQSTR